MLIDVSHVIETTDFFSHTSVGVNTIQEHNYDVSLRIHQLYQIIQRMKDTGVNCQITAFGNFHCLVSFVSA
jgi:hypothetical protein